jgi:hypothetical protein
MSLVATKWPVKTVSRARVESRPDNCVQVIRAPPFLKETGSGDHHGGRHAVTQWRARADWAVAPLAMLERWFFKRLAGIRAANLGGSHKSRFFFSDTEGGSEGIFHLPGKKYGHASRRGRATNWGSPQE